MKDSAKTLNKILDDFKSDKIKENREDKLKELGI